MSKRKRLGIVEVTIEKNRYPFEGLATVDGMGYRIKNALAGQRIEAKLTRKRQGYYLGKTIQVLEKAPYEGESACLHFPACGGCLLQSVSYEDQARLLEDQVLELFEEHGIKGFEYDGMLVSPQKEHYRNKMEYNFGNAFKEGPMTLGMHPRGRIHDVINTFECQIAPKDFNRIQAFTQAYFLNQGTAPYNKNTHKGVLRHLVLRQGMKTREILIGLVTSSQEKLKLEEYVQEVTRLDLEGEIVGVVHVINDAMADAVIPEHTEIIFGRDFYYDEILGLTFKVSLFSFFQTNPLGAEILYDRALGYIEDSDGKVLFDLFSGTGTLGQLMASRVKEVFGIELVEDAVEMANENAGINGLDNCTFIAGDVFEKLDNLNSNPDIIIVDPPRVGISEKAMKKIIAYKVPEIVYVSCNPKTIVENIKAMEEGGYRVRRLTLVDLFPGTPHVETVCLLTRK
ncbi:MAG: hypothetical protein AVO33_00905 [delta proteobacterium ML8_F1]|nr:MAG: hypothetical protein AVO33_00905 [delta proteobacterium ML8_F1]